MFLTTSLLVTLIALIIERLFGYPRWIYARIGHPVEYFGRLIAKADARLNQPEKSANLRRLAGLATIIGLVAAGVSAAVIVIYILRPLPYGWLAEALLAAPFIAQSELQRFVARVADGLDISLDAGREAVSHIVGRDPANLDESGVARAAIESLAENTSDGIVAPAFWLAIGGLPGIIAYKIVNTADSMIGYKSEKHLHFGWAAARLDDLMNLIPARISGLFFAGAAALTSPAAGADALQAMWRDASAHTSPNAGWPEAAMAGALNIQLGGLRTYNGHLTDLPTMGHGKTTLTPKHIRHALRLYKQKITLLTIMAFFCWLFV